MPSATFFSFTSSCGWPFLEAVLVGSFDPTTLALGLRERDTVRAMETSAAGFIYATMLGPLDFVPGPATTGGCRLLVYLECDVGSSGGMVLDRSGQGGRLKLDDRAFHVVTLSVLERLRRTGRRPVWRTKSSVVRLGAYLDKGIYFESLIGSAGGGGEGVLLRGFGDEDGDIGGEIACTVCVGFFWGRPSGLIERVVLGVVSSTCSSTGDGTSMFKPSSRDLSSLFLLNFLVDALSVSIA